jgi:hypothetical protein
LKVPVSNLGPETENPEFAVVFLSPYKERLKLLLQAGYPLQAGTDRMAVLEIQS